jgi:glyoxylase-like metal-dependent hydrolase (beta-lactamase superfamily II)
MKPIRSGTNFARYEMGGLTIVALRDGYVDMPPSRLRQEGNRAFGADLPQQVPLFDGQLRLSVNAFLLIEHGQHILIDTGAGDAWFPTMGLLHDALAEAGIARDQIRTVAFTHTHNDHVNGLVTPDGAEAFPNLETLFVPQEEISLFDRSERLKRFRPRCTPFGAGFSVSDSITAIEAHGHSPGHTAFEVTGGGSKLLIWGDIVHVPAIQFGKPELTWEFDRDQPQARASRERMLKRTAQPDTFIAGAHLDFPGVGRVSGINGAYRFSAV